MTELEIKKLQLEIKAIEKASINAVIIKPNQIGTLSETLETMQLARENNIELIVSHRSGETDDDFIADLAFAFGCYGLKSGSPRKPERMVKYRRLMDSMDKIDTHGKEMLWSRASGYERPWGMRRVTVSRRYTTN